MISKSRSTMVPLQIDAVYENGLLRRLQPLDLTEHERVVLTVSRAEPVSDLEEIRRRLGRIPGSMSDEIIAARGDR